MEKLEQYERLSYQDRKLSLRAIIPSYQHTFVKDIRLSISFKIKAKNHLFQAVKY